MLSKLIYFGYLLSMPAGRQRSETSRCSILVTALQLARSVGYDQLTIEAIAAQAGVGKQTIYRWWPAKADVVLEALRENAGQELAEPDSGSLLADLTEYLRSTLQLEETRPGMAHLLGALLAEAQKNTAFSKAFHRDILEPRKATLARIFARSRERGEIGPEADHAALVDLAMSSIWFRWMAGSQDSDADFARSMALLLAQAAGFRVG